MKFSILLPTHEMAPGRLIAPLSDGKVEHEVTRFIHFMGAQAPIPRGEAGSQIKHRNLRIVYQICAS